MKNISRQWRAKSIRDITGVFFVMNSRWRHVSLLRIHDKISLSGRERLMKVFAQARSTSGEIVQSAGDRGPA